SRPKPSRVWKITFQENIPLKRSAAVIAHQEISAKSRAAKRRQNCSPRREPWVTVEMMQPCRGDRSALTQTVQACISRILLDLSSRAGRLVCEQREQLKEPGAEGSWFCFFLPTGY